MSVRGWSQHLVGRPPTRTPDRYRCNENAKPLVKAIADLIKSRFDSREAFRAALNEHARTKYSWTSKKERLSRQALSEQLGSARKKRGPDHDIVLWAVEVCVADPAERAATLARIAGLYEVAQGEPLPNYRGPVQKPADTTADMGADSATKTAKSQVSAADTSMVVPPTPVRTLRTLRSANRHRSKRARALTTGVA